MGTLKPGASYFYEKVNGVIYARETGTTDRFEIGRDYSSDDLEEMDTWNKILEESRKNPILRKEVDRVKVIYYMSKKDGSKT